jgi:hypothetical protein
MATIAMIATIVALRTRSADSGVCASALGAPGLARGSGLSSGKNRDHRDDAEAKSLSLSDIPRITPKGVTFTDEGLRGSACPIPRPVGS